MDLESAYNMRKQLYENREMFYNMAEEPSSDDEDSSEFKHISEMITRGRDTIRNEIISSNCLNQEKTQMFSLQNDINNVIDQFQKKIDVLGKNVFFDEDAKNHIDNIMYSLGCIQESLSKDVNKKLSDIEEKLKKSKKIMKKLSKSYVILKDMSIGYSCPVCMANMIDVYCMPCGHCHCSHCIAKSNFCPMCRSRIQQVNKLYMC